MNLRTKQIAAVVAGAVALAAGGYALGRTGDDGSTRSGTTARESHPAGSSAASRNLAILAGKLGVTPARLRDALQKLRVDRKQKSDAAHAKVASDLARALHMPRAKVLAALNKPHSLRKLRAAYARQLGSLLSVDAAKVGTALADQRAGRILPGVPALATKLGVTEAELRVAVKSLQPGVARRRRDDRITALARDLGIGEPKLRAALKGLSGVFARERAATRDKLAADLSRHLGIPKSKVDKALASPGKGGTGGP